MIDKIKIGENEEVGAINAILENFGGCTVFKAEDVEKAINYACGQVPRDVTAEKPKPEPSFRYELVTDLDRNGVAKAMIDGEIFYSESGDSEFYWNSGGVFHGKDVGTTLEEACVVVCGTYYRKVETQWHEKLDGTMENSVACWVSNDDEHVCTYTAIISSKGDYGYEEHGASKMHWKHAIPFFKR